MSKKWFVSFFAVLFLFTCAFSNVTVSAENNTLVRVYIRNDNNPIPYANAEKPADEYFYAAQGYLKVVEECYDLRGVEDRLVRTPSVPAPEGQTVLWYEIVKDGNIWRLHGAFVPSDELKIVNQPLETDNKGNVTSARATIIIPENAEGNLVIPLDFLNQFDQNVSMPGDTYTYYFTIINKSKWLYSYMDASFQVTVDGDLDDPTWQTFYEKLFSVSFTRALDMSSAKDTDCGIANYLDPAEEKYKEVNALLTDLLRIQPNAQSDEQRLYIGLNGPLMGNAYANCTFGGEMKLVLTPSSPSQPDTGEKTSLGIVTPKRMSVRFEDGKIYKNGDSLEIETGKTYRFQMCSNNWETDVYDDNGNGLCGTVVYSVRVSDRYDERSYDEDTKTFVLPKGDPVLRTDINSCFMAYRYHFTKGDYNKQTGIEHVVDTPLESLSVNLPLGSTIKSDAYRGYQQIDTAHVFIERGEDLALSYTDYYWNH